MLSLTEASERRASVSLLDFYNSHGIENEFHYINITDEEWHRRIEKRNSDISAGRLNAYYVDSGLAEKFGRIFEPPATDEIDVLT